jgi:hypothetical protein
VTDTIATKEERWDIDQALASTLITLQKEQEAVPLLREILDQQVKLLGPKHVTVWESQLLLARTLRSSGSPSAALELLRDRQQQVDPTRLSVQSRWEGPHLIGAILLDQQQNSEAERWLTEAYMVATEGMPGTWPWAWSGALLGRTHQLQGNHVRSQELFDLSLASLRSLEATLPLELRSLSDVVLGWADKNR